MPSFIHTADVHLDTPFSARFTQKQMQLRRKELMQTFQTIVRAAEKKDFLFISGDLFDGEFVSLETASFLQRAFSEIKDPHPRGQLFGEPTGDLNAQKPLCCARMV